MRDSIVPLVFLRPFLRLDLLGSDFWLKRPAFGALIRVALLGLDFEGAVPWTQCEL